MDKSGPFQTGFRYRNRETKAEYVWKKYQSILTGEILDVGADECHLKRYISADARYWGIGLGGHLDQEVDLEKQGIPFPNNSFDCVLCLDVLEHVDNLHAVFDDLCRVTRRYVIISLPNPWASFFQMLRSGYYSETRPLKFYSLPVEPLADRHKWFFGAREAEEFFRGRGGKNGMSVVQIDRVKTGGRRTRMTQSIVRRIVHGDVDVDSLFSGPIWAVLRKD